MKITDEQIERLMRYADVSRSEARRALEQSDGDLLNALALLLSSGRKPQHGSRLRRALHRIWRFLVENRLVVYNPRGSGEIDCPAAALLALLVLAWYAVLFFLLLAVCAGWSFRVEGPQLGRSGLNSVLNALNAAAGRLRGRVRAALRRIFRGGGR